MFRAPEALAEVNGVAPAKKAIPFTDDDVDPELVHQVFRPYLVTLTLAAEDRLKLTDTGNLTGASLQLLCDETGINRRVREDIGATLAEPTTFLIAREVLWPRT